jgi:hypothetical protein
MNIKVTDRTELMFSQAVTLSQSGMMKNTIHAKEKDLFILNMDDTILIHFNMNQEFPEAVSFFANDYESNDMLLENGQLVFITHSEGHTRKKTCPSTKIKFNDVKEIWNAFNPDINHVISLNKIIISLLDDDLSHLEIHNQNGIKLVQKNIYSGARVEIENKTAQEGLLGDGLSIEFDPIGIRTTDFKALFSFVEDLNFYIQPGKNWVYFKDTSGVLEGILSTCIYDEIGYIAKVEV